LETIINKITPPKGTDINKWLPPYSLFIIDEANRFCPPKPKLLPAAVADLNDQNRHYLMSVGYVARRPWDSMTVLSSNTTHCKKSCPWSLKLIKNILVPPLKFPEK
jgi:hypothetical protein